MPLGHAGQHEGGEQRFLPPPRQRRPQPAIVADRKVQCKRKDNHEHIKPPQDAEVHPVEVMQAGKELRPMGIEKGGTVNA